MEIIDSTANAVGLSILSLGIVPNAPTTPVATPPADFSQQLQALTAAIADPQQLAVELQAAGLLEQLPVEQGATAGDGFSSAILSQLADLVARLLKDGAASAPDEAPAVIEQDAVTPADQSTDETDANGSHDDLSEVPSTEIVAAPPTVLSAALLQTLTVFVVDPHKSSIVTPIADDSTLNTVPATPVGLIQTLSPATIAVALPTLPDVPADSSTADATDEQLPALEITEAATAPPTNFAAAAAANVLPPVVFVSMAEPAPTPAKPAGDVAVATNNVSTPTMNVKSQETESPPVIGKTEAVATSTVPDSAEGLTPLEPASRSPETSSPSDQRWLAPTSSSSTAPVTDASQPESRTLPPHDAVRMVERLGQYVVEARDQGRQLVVQITPPDLGPLHIEVGTQNGLLTARLETNSTVAQQLLQEHLPQLHEALQRLGANVERIDVVRTEPLARDREWDRSNGIASDGDWSATSEQSSPDRRDEPRRPNPQPPRSAKVSNTSSSAPATGTLQELNIRI